MAQFDVHANRGARRTDVPYVVLVQSALFDSYRRRVVVPLVRVGVLPADIQSAGSRMHPVFDIHGQRVVLQPLASKPSSRRVKILDECAIDLIAVCSG